MAYQYFPRDYPKPGTGNYAFDAGMTLPLFQVQGAGIIPSRSLNVLQFGNVINQSTLTLTDYTNGGMVAGQLIGQPLSPPANSNNG